MTSERQGRAIPALLTLGVALALLLLLFFIPSQRSEAKTTWVVNDTQSWTFDGTHDFRKNVSFTLNVTIPGKPTDFDLLPSLREAESYNYTFTNDSAAADPPFSVRGSITWINLSLNGVPIAHARNADGGSGFSHSHDDLCGEPCSLSDIRYNTALREGTNEVRFEVAYLYYSHSSEPLNVTVRAGPVRMTLFEHDKDADGVSDRYQPVRGVPSLIVGLAAAVPASGLTYFGARRITWTRKP